MDEQSASHHFLVSQITELNKLAEIMKPIKEAEFFDALVNTSKNEDEIKTIIKNYQHIPSYELKYLHNYIINYGSLLTAWALVSAKPFTPNNAQGGVLKLKAWFDSSLGNNWAGPPDKKVISYSAFVSNSDKFIPHPCPYIVERYFAIKCGYCDMIAKANLGRLVCLHDQELLIYAISSLSEWDEPINDLDGLCQMILSNPAHQFLQQVIASDLDDPNMEVEEIPFMEVGEVFTYESNVGCEPSPEFDEEIFQLGYDQDVLNLVALSGERYETDPEEEITAVFPPPENAEVAEEPDWDEAYPEEEEPIYPSREVKNEEEKGDEFGFFGNGNQHDYEEEEEDEFGPFGYGNQGHYEDEIPSYRYYDYSTEDTDAMDGEELNEYNGGDYIDQWLENQE